MLVSTSTLKPQIGNFPRFSHQKCKGLSSTLRHGVLKYRSISFVDGDGWDRGVEKKWAGRRRICFFTWEEMLSSHSLNLGGIVSQKERSVEIS